MIDFEIELANVSYLLNGVLRKHVLRANPETACASVQYDRKPSVFYMESLMRNTKVHNRLDRCTSRSEPLLDSLFLNGFSQGLDSYIPCFCFCLPVVVLVTWLLGYNYILLQFIFPYTLTMSTLLVGCSHSWSTSGAVCKEATPCLWKVREFPLWCW